MSKEDRSIYVWFLSSGYTIEQHLDLIQAYSAALATGSWRNKAHQARCYLRFCADHQVAPLSPDVYDVLSYLRHLQLRLKAPASVANYLSGARTWIAHNLGNTAPFTTYPVSVLKKGIARNSLHLVHQAPSLSPDSLRHVLLYLLSSSTASPVFVMLLIVGFTTLLRQSNLLLPSPLARSRHILLFPHITASDTALEVTVSSTKTRFLSEPPLAFVLPALPDSPLCPVRSWNRYLATVTPLPTDPAFLLPSRTPLAVPLMTQVLRLALKQTGHTSPEFFTLHSLRRGAARACISLGLPEAQVKEAGTWAGDAFYTYVPRNLVKKVPAALTNLLG